MDYLFVDLHLHSTYSHEDLCDESPEHIISKVQGYIDKYNQANGANASCCISICDHNSILGCVNAQQVLSSGKYPNVQFINGCEFTTDLGEINNLLGIQNTFTRCHVLAYGYDVTNKELLAYSEIAHKRFSNEDNIGLQICAARRAVCEKYNIYIPFSAFISLASLNQKDNYVKPFLKIVEKQLNRNGILYDYNEVYECIGKYLVGAQTYIEESTSAGRLKISEVSKLIHDAGGKMVFAHPATMNIGITGLKRVLNQRGLDGEATANEIKKKVSAKRVRLLQLDHQTIETALVAFLELTQKVCDGRGFDGMEPFNGVNFVGRADLPIRNVCLMRGLFQTAGSDYHGENFTNHKTIGNCFQQPFQRQYGIINNRMQDRGLFVRVSNMPFANLMVEGGADALTEIKFVDEHFEVVSQEKIEECLAHERQKRQEYHMQSQQFEQTHIRALGTKEIRQQIENLTTIAERYNKILKKSLNYKARRRLLYKLELFCYNIYKGLKAFQENFREHADHYDVEDVKRVTTLLKEIHRKYYEMVRLDNGIMYEVESRIKKEHEIQETTMDKIADLTIQK